MTAYAGPDTTAACHTLLAAAGEQRAEHHHLAAVFIDYPDPDVDLAHTRLHHAGLTRENR